MYGDDEYLEAQVMTASPHHLHMLVVDGAIRFATRAEQALEQGDIEAAHYALNNSRGFVSELIGGLDDSRAPEVVANLKSLFGFVFRRLAEADLNRDAGMVRDALQVLRLHRETWSALGEKLKEQPDGEMRIDPPERPDASPGHGPPEPPAPQTGRSWTT